MARFYSKEQRTLQQHFETEKMADLLVQAIVHPEIQDAERAFIESRDMFFLATVDGAGQPTCSYKGGDPGFVRVIEPTTLAFPSYDGNGMFLSLGNVRATARVGILFVDFEKPHRLGVQGTASVDAADPLLVDHGGADAIVRVRVSEVFVNCSRYVPRAHCETPYAEWKRIDLVQDALPPRDAGKTERAGGTISQAEYEAKLAAGDA